MMERGAWKISLGETQCSSELMANGCRIVAICWWLTGIFCDAGGGNTILAAPFLVLGRRFEKDVNDEDLNGELGLVVMQLEKVMEMKTFDRYGAGAVVMIMEAEGAN